jgi:hypothetical protein
VQEIVAEAVDFEELLSEVVVLVPPVPPQEAIRKLKEHANIVAVSAPVILFFITK